MAWVVKAGAKFREQFSSKATVFFNVEKIGMTQRHLGEWKTMGVCACLG
jgi:hypothetical protein